MINKERKNDQFLYAVNSYGFVKVVYRKVFQWKNILLGAIPIVVLVTLGFITLRFGKLEELSVIEILVVGFAFGLLTFISGYLSTLQWGEGISTLKKVLLPIDFYQFEEYKKRYPDKVYMTSNTDLKKIYNKKDEPF